MNAHELKTRLFEITGNTDDIEQALDQWEQERQTMSDMFYENERLVLLDAKSKLVIAQAIVTVNKIELDANMFIKPAARAHVLKFRTMCSDLASGRDLEMEKKMNDLLRKDDHDVNKNT